MGGKANTELHQPGKEAGQEGTLCRGPGLRPPRQGSGMAQIPGRNRELLAPKLAIKPPVPNNAVTPSHEAGTSLAPSPGEQ